MLLKGCLCQRMTELEHTDAHLEPCPFETVMTNRSVSINLI